MDSNVRFHPLEGASRDRDGLRTRIDQLEAAHGDSLRQIEASRTQLTSAQAALSDTRRLAADNSAQIENLGRARDGLKRQLDAALAALESTNADRDEKVRSVESLNKRVEGLQAALDARDAVIRGLQRASPNLSAQGKIWPGGVTVFRSPDGVNGTGTTLGWFSADTEVDVLRRVAGPSGWDALEVHGVTAETHRSVSGFVRADLVVGTTAPIAPQSGRRCFTAHDTPEYGVARLYDPSVVQKMALLDDTNYDSLIKARLPDDGRIFATINSIRGPNGWEWVVVNFANNFSGVVRADQLHIATCPE
jgi:hypothetical protein